MRGMAFNANTAGGASKGISAVPARNNAAMQHGSWRRFTALSSRLAGLLAGLPGLAGGIEYFLDSAGFDRAPWLAVGFGTGIGLWFTLDSPWQWLELIALSLAVALATAAFMSAHGRFPYIRLGVITMAMMIAAGCVTVWTKSTMVGTPPISYPTAAWITGRVLDRTDEPAEHRLRLVLATRE